MSIATTRAALDAAKALYRLRAIADEQRSTPASERLLVAAEMELDAAQEVFDAAEALEGVKAAERES